MLRQHLIKNPIDRSKPNPYASVAKKFGLSKEQVRRVYRSLREQGLVESVTSTTKSSRQFKENVKKGEADVTVVTKRRIKTLKDLLEVCEVDEKEWEVLSWEANKWEVGRKDRQVDWNVTDGLVESGKVNDSGKIFVEPLFQVKAKLSRRKLSNDIVLQKEALLAELKAFSPSVKLPSKDRYKFDSKETLLEICIFDAHFGKLAWRSETGEDYDLKIAETRVKNAIQDLLSRVNLKNVNKILFPVGNDLINIDNKNNTTANGTPQDTDVRFMKIIKAVRRILVEIISDLSVIAPVDVLIVPGNHDTTSSFMIGEILDAFFANNERVFIDNSPKVRKYYRFGVNGFQFTHGNEEKHSELGLIFATEEAKLWADTKHRFVQLGHFHKNKKTEYTSVDQYQGFMVQVLPSLSGKDAWHYKKGYDTLKQAKAFLYDINKGLIGEFTTTAS